MARILFIFIVSSFAILAKSQCFLVPSEACVGDCGPVFYLQNDPDGTTYEWSITCGTITNPMQANPHTVCFDSAGTCEIQVIIGVPGENPDTCTAMIEVMAPSLSEVIDSTCEGDSIEINGMYYTPGFYTDTILGGSANGCDSILLITVNTIFPDSTFINYTGCEGDSFSIVVNGNIYNEGNPSGIEYLEGSNGCDSIVFIELVFLPATASDYIYFGCQGDSFFIIINNTVYNELNPTGVEVVSASNGCDSVITINLTFFPHQYDTISYSGCSGDGFSVMVGTNEYNEENPSGIDTLPGGCDTIVVIDLHFDSINASLTLSGNQLCASPSGLEYSWMDCDSNVLPDSTECIAVSGQGCGCVIISDNGCQDTVCLEYNVCDITCDVIAPPGACLGDSVLLTAQTNASDSAMLSWVISLDSDTLYQINGMDSVWMFFNSTGCYAIALQISDLGCQASCKDTMCVVNQPLADLCCDELECDTCVDLDVQFFGTPPWTFAISDGAITDTVIGITGSQYDYRVCPEPDFPFVYTLLWMVDSSGLCNGGIINDSVTVYLEHPPEASIAELGDSLCANPPGLSYTWTDCENSLMLGNNACFVPTVSGCYCVTVSNLLTDCIDSACVNFVFTNTTEFLQGEEIKIWYDTENHLIKIKGIHSHQRDFSIQLFDISGRTIPFLKTEWIGEDVLEITPGKYLPALTVVNLITHYSAYAKALFIPIE